VGDDVGREGVQSEGHQPARRAGKVPREREDDQREEQRQQDHRQACQQHHAPRVVARLVQQAPPQRLLVAGESGVEAYLGEGQPGADEQLAQRRVFGVEPQAVLVQVDDRGAHVHGLVDGRCLLDGGGDHGDRHPAQQRHDDERVQPPPVPPEPVEPAAHLPGAGRARVRDCCQASRLAGGRGGAGESGDRHLRSGGR
jgi:hypothetical protein